MEDMATLVFVFYGAIPANGRLTAHFTGRQSSIWLEPIVIALGNFVVSRSHLLLDVGSVL